MAAENIIERSFSGGEIAPALYARVDQSKYQTGLRTARNLICMRHGGVTQRPGTMYVGTTLNAGAQVRLIPFIFNETGLGQSYVLEFGNQYIAFYQNGGVIVTAPNTPYTIVSPYLQADLKNLQFAQSADVITITHPSYAPMELKRIAPTNWTLTAIVFGAKSFFTTFTSVTGTAGSNTYGYVVTSVLPNGDEGTFINSRTTVAINVAAPAPSSPVNLAWLGELTAFAIGVSSFRIYRATVGTQTGPFGYIGTVVAPPASNPATPVYFTDDVSTPDYTNPPPVASPFETSMGPGFYPSTVAFVQQRRCFAAWNNNVIGAAMSKPGSYANFDTHIGTATPDDDPIFFSIAGEEINSIQHLLELKFMLMLTGGAELFVQGNGSGVVTPSAINASVQSQYGASPLRPIKVGDAVIFNQALGNFIRDLAFDFVIDGYRGNDLTVFSAHLFEGHQIVDWAYQKIPDSILWAVREDGVLLSLTYIREQQILAWTRHDFFGAPLGVVQNVCCIPENGNYAVYVTIMRNISGVNVVYLERLSSRIWQGPPAAVANGTANALGDPIDATYLDCYSVYDGRNITVQTMTLASSPANTYQTGPLAYQQQLILSSSIGNYFGPGYTAQVGDQIFLEDALFLSSGGQQGQQLKLTIQDISNTSTVIVTPDKQVSSTFQNITTTRWSRAVQTVTGLSYLRGQQVSVWADRSVVGSPLNRGIDQVYFPLLDSIKLDKPYAVIYVGLPMFADFETLAIDTSFGDSLMGDTKAISSLVVYLYNTRGFFGGTQNPDTDPDNTLNDALFNLTENKAQGNRQFYDSPPSLLTDWQITNIECNWSKEGRIFIRNVDPIPLSILAVVPAGLTSAKMAWSQKV